MESIINNSYSIRPPLLLLLLLRLKISKFSLLQIASTDRDNNVCCSNKKFIVSALSKTFTSKIFFFELELIGLGYRISIKKSRIRLSLGYSHIIFLLMPKGINIFKKKNRILVYGLNRRVFGDFISNLLKFKKLNPYKLKGLKKKNLIYKLKPGKRSK